MSVNANSILDSVKKAIGFESEYTAFDVDITMFINAAFGSLQQLGVGGDSGFVISDNTVLWSQYCPNPLYQGMIKQFIFMTVKLAFDPPPTSFGLEAIEKQLDQLAWRINIAAETINPPDDPMPAEIEPPFTWIDAFFGDVDLQPSTVFKVKATYLPFSPTVESDASLFNTFYLTMDGDCTINAPVSGTDGEHITFILTSNGHNATWGPGWNFGNNGEPSLSTDGKDDIISAVWRASASEWYAGYSPGF